jgi:hypothetical protein
MALIVLISGQGDSLRYYGSGRPIAITVSGPPHRRKHLQSSLRSWRIYDLRTTPSSAPERMLKSAESPPIYLFMLLVAGSRCLKAYDRTCRYQQHAAIHPEHPIGISCFTAEIKIFCSSKIYHRVQEAETRMSTSTDLYRGSQLNSMTTVRPTGCGREEVVRELLASPASSASTPRARWPSNRARFPATTPLRARQPRSSTPVCANSSNSASRSQPSAPIHQARP